MADKNYSGSNLKMLITIIPRAKAEFYTDLIQSFDSNMQFTALAEGTASSDMLAKFNIVSKEKAVIFSIIKEEKCKEALQTLEEKFTSIKNGKGIAFTVPLSSVIGVSVFGFLSNNRTLLKEN